MRLFFFLAISLSISAVIAKECRHRIIFLPQFHSSDYEKKKLLTNEQKRLILDSQFRIAKYIEKHPNIPIFSEQTANNDFSLNRLAVADQNLLKKYYHQIFPNGLPQNFGFLNDLQKQKLFNYGGDFVQVILGHVQILHKVIDNEKEKNEIYGPIQKWLDSSHSSTDSYPPEIGRLAYGARERAALLQAKKYFSANQNQKNAIMIFGLNHNFGFYQDIFPPECVIIPNEFKDDWYGRMRSGPEGFPHSTLPNSLPKNESAIR